MESYLDDAVGAAVVLADDADRTVNVHVWKRASPRETQYHEYNNTLLLWSFNLILHYTQPFNSYPQSQAFSQSYQLLAVFPQFPACLIVQSCSWGTLQSSTALSLTGYCTVYWGLCSLTSIIDKTLLVEVKYWTWKRMFVTIWSDKKHKMKILLLCECSYWYNLFWFLCLKVW